MTNLSIICNGRAIPFLWSVMELLSATIGFEIYRPLLRKASWLLRNQNNVMLLADRGFANSALLKWLRGTIHKGRKLLQLLPLPYGDPERCFASRQAEADYYEQLLFSRIRSVHCST